MKGQNDQQFGFFYTVPVFVEYTIWFDAIFTENIWIRNLDSDMQDGSGIKTSRKKILFNSFNCLVSLSDSNAPQFVFVLFI